MPCKRLGSPVGTVSADDHHSVDSVLSADIRSLLLVFLFLEFQTSCRAQYSTALLNNVGHVPGLHINDILIQQTIVPFLDALYLQSPINSGADYGPDGCVHARCVSPACQNCNRLNFVCHNCVLL